jgi:hypothetical protein
MTRLILAFVVSTIVTASAFASVTPRKEFSRLGDERLPLRALALSTRVQVAGAEGGAESPFALTDQTEVLLNGRPCRYEAIPAQARITLLELAGDKKTVLRIHFRTEK